MTLEHYRLWGKYNLLEENQQSQQFYILPALPLQVSIEPDVPPVLHKASSVVVGFVLAYSSLSFLLSIPTLLESCNSGRMGVRIVSPFTIFLSFSTQYSTFP
jgi:hypothetical protein